MQVGVNISFVFPTSRTYPTTIAGLLVQAIDVLRICNGQRQSPTAIARQEQLGMTDPVLCNCLYQLLLYVFLTDDLFKLHLVQNNIFLTHVYKQQLKLTKGCPVTF